MLYDIDEKPGMGVYQCAICIRWRVRLENDETPLPPCGLCAQGQKVKYLKLA